jgi:protein required for attachment to host cells
MSKTWIVVANRVRARLFEYDPRQRNVSEIEDFLNPEGRAPAGSRGENRPPRTFDSEGPGRHAIEPRTEPATKASEQFARQLAAALEDGRVHRRFEKLMLIATPRFLGHLRQCMPAALGNCVTRQVNKDLTQATPDAIRKLVTEPFQGET